MNSSVEFDFSGPALVDDAFNAVRWKKALELGPDTRFHDVPCHVKPLVGLKYQLDASDISLSNAEDLAKGHRRLLIVLLEPSGQENEELTKEAREWPRTLEEIDWLLSDASGGTLGMINTCIFDRRPLRFRHLRDGELEREKAIHDKLAYQTFERMVYKLKPDVIVCCQCDTYDIETPMTQILCSQMSRAGEAVECDIAGKPTTIVYGFHPSNYLNDYYLKRYIQDRRKSNVGEGPVREVVEQSLQDLLRYTFHVAINALAGCRVTGAGLEKLRHACLLPAPSSVPARM